MRDSHLIFQRISAEKRTGFLLQKIKHKALIISKIN